MKKIRLDLDALKVESFVTSHMAGTSEGTVFAMINTVCDATCDGMLPTCRGDQGDCDWSDECENWTDPEELSCTGGQLTFTACDPHETEQECSEELTVCCGPTE